MSRRALLGGISAAGMASLLPRGFRSRALAQDAAPPTRVIFVHVPEGMWNGAPRPSAGSTNLGPILEALQPWQERIIVMNGLNMQSRDHGPGGDGHHRGVPHMFTGTEMQDEDNAGGTSIDQKIANAIGRDSQFPSLAFAVRIVYGDTNSRAFWTQAGRVVAPMQNPWDAYDRVLSGVMPSGGGPTTPPPPAAFDLRRSAVDFALGEINSLRTRLPASDRERLDSYQESLRDIERRLMTVPTMPPVGSSCTPPTLGSEVNAADERNYPRIGQLQMDIIVAALQCNVTRVATLQWGNSNDQCTYPWLGVNTLGHDMAHNNSNCDPSGSKKLTTYKWYSEQAAYLLDKLNSIPEGTGTMLDNTVILWASEFGESNGHSSNNLMWLLMGNVNGYFRQGRVINCGGKSTNDVHTTIGNAMGLTDQTFGNPAYCDGPLADLL
jgi:hypothetical protein